MTDRTLREAAQELVENKGPFLDGVVRHVGEHYVEALAAALADSADAPEGPCSQCGGETYVVDLTRCRGCSNEFYTADQSRAASRNRLDAQEKPDA